MLKPILAALLLLAPAAVQAGDLSGKVFDATALPVAGAVVLVGEHEAVTGADGSYLVAGLAAGEHEVAVRLADGAVQSVWAEVSATGTAHRNVFLVSAAAVAGAQHFAAEQQLRAADLPALPQGEAEMVAWRWRDGDA